MRNLLLAFLLAFCAWGSLQAADFSAVKSRADSAYADRLYTEAIQGYKEALSIAPSSEVYYNLGNAHFRLSNLPQAVLAYERSLHLNPGNADARFNLELVRSRLTDRFAQPSRMFFLTWWSEWVSQRSATTWMLIAFLWLLGAGLAAGIYRASLPLRWRKLGFGLMLIALLIALLALVLAFQQQQAHDHNARAVILAPEVQSYSSPTTTSRPEKLLHEGTTVEILSREQKQWLQVGLPDGTEVWVPNKDIEPVVLEKENS